MASDIHNKDFALRLVLKERLGGTQNWPIKQPGELELCHLKINRAFLQVHKYKNHFLFLGIFFFIDCFILHCLEITYFQCLAPL